MKLDTHGKSTLKIEVENISKHGFWLFINGKEYFLAFSDYPWFKNARINEILDVKLLHGTHLYWEKLDIDLELESLDNPAKYPLVYKN
jgi:hypothetical protein